MGRRERAALRSCVSKWLICNKFVFFSENLHLSQNQNYFGANTMNSLPELDDDAITQRLHQSRQLEDAPEHVVQRALDLWQMSRRAQAGPNLIRRIIAVLTFDSSGMSPAAFGMRSAAGTMRQMLFSAEGHDVDLRISPIEGDSNDPSQARWQLSGQVLGPDCSGALVLTDSNGSAVRQSTLDDLGEFRLPAVRSGSYVLTLRLVETEIVLSTIDIPQKP